MDRDEASLRTTGFETDRLLLRPWRAADATFHRRLWLERDPRVPARRRITPDGHPTLAELESWEPSHEPEPWPGLLVAEQRGTPTAIGYCGLISNSVGRPDEPELAFEFLRRFWNHGFATEASRAIVDHAREHGYRNLAATVRDWNRASLRVLDKLGFVNTGEREPDDSHGDSLLLRVTL